MSKYSFTDDLVNSRGEVVVSTKCFIPNYIVDEIKSDGYEQGKADTKSDIAKECKYLLACGMGKKKSLEHLIKILEKEQK